LQPGLSSDNISRNWQSPIIEDRNAVKLIRTLRLQRAQKNTTVHCEIDLCQLPGSHDRYLVNLRQGRRNVQWRETTRTPHPVDLATAETLFALAAAERSAQGFVDADHAVALPQADTLPLPAPVRDNPARRDADAAILSRLEPARWKSLGQHLRNRTIWRIGERRLRTAVPVLVDQIERGDPLQDYCIAWAIGRCGDAGAAIAMQELHKRGRTDSIQRIALQSWLTLADAPALKAQADGVIALWPAWLRALWEAGDEPALLALTPVDQRWDKLPMQDWLEQLDRVAFTYPLARRVLLAQVRCLPVRAGLFRAQRHLYKAAEMRGDAELLGILHHRFETSHESATGATSMYTGRRWVSFAEEAAKPNAKLAYSTRTRHYLLQRSWRSLRRLGSAGDPAYVDRALGMLAAMTDDSTGTMTPRAGRYYDQYGHWLLFNRMLRAHGPWIASRSGMSWYQKSPIKPHNARQEAFPALWDARPDALLSLMQTSRCEGVHEFAALALRANSAWCDKLPLNHLRALLRSSYQATVRFAFEVTRERFSPGVPDADWLMLLLQTSLPEAHQYVLACISHDPAKYCADALLVAAVACSPEEAVRRHGRLLCQCALTLPGQAQAIVLQLLDWLDNCGDLEDAEARMPAIAADLLWLLNNPLRTAAAEAPYTHLLHLLEHRLSSVRVLAGEWLLLHKQSATAIPGPTLAAILQSSDAIFRAVGVKLFSSLPDHVLAQQAQLIYAFATNTDAGVRAAIDPVMQRLAPIDPVFRATLLPLLLDALFRSEPAEGVHDDVIAWLSGPFKEAPELSERDLAVRLLAARSKGAQQFGGRLLPRHRAEEFSVADWATLARNPVAAVREWAFAAYTAHAATVRTDMEAALRIFDSRFDDSIVFAERFFSTQCGSDDWTPLLLVNLCDHLSPAVQRFGRSMITAHFNVGDITEFMLKLSQHPSANMQLFVSAWLESACAGDAGELHKLESYFLSVLSQVNKGRPAKARVQAFLREQAVLSEPIAALVARIFARQVVTVAIADKAQYIEGLRAIQDRYPNLADVMTIHAPRAYAAARGTP